MHKKMAKKTDSILGYVIIGAFLLGLLGALMEWIKANKEIFFTVCIISVEYSKKNKTYLVNLSE